MNSWQELSAPERAEIIRRALAMREEGATWNAIGRALDFRNTTIRFHCDPEFRKKSNESKRYLRPGGRFHYFSSENDPISTRTDALRRLAEIPEDTRSLTARTFGDPLPGRRACDLRARMGARE